MTHKGDIYPITIPKWGMAMEEGLLAAWHMNEGATVVPGDQLADIETEKIANCLEASQAGILRRQIGKAGESYPCGALIGVIAEAAVTDEEIASFVTQYAGPSQRSSVEISGPTPQMTEVRGHALRYLHQGTGGVPIVFIHGWAGDLNNWLFLQSALSDRRATYAIDLPGHGASGKDVSQFHSLADVAELLLAFLDQLALPKVHLVAHSMGAAVALDLGRRHEKRVVSLTLLSALGLGETPAPEFVNGLIAAGSRREMAPILKMLLSDDAQVSREMVNDLLKFKRLDGVEAALRHFAAFFNQENRTAAAAMADIKPPIQLVWGTQDRIMRPPDAAKLPRDVRLTLLDNTGHMPHLESSSKVVELINTFSET